jgi:hypothetical protein
MFPLDRIGFGLRCAKALDTKANVTANRRRTANPSLSDEIRPEGTRSRIFGNVRNPIGIYKRLRCGDPHKRIAGRPRLIVSPVEPSLPQQPVYELIGG